MLKLAIIADDLTGAGDTGVQFSKFGLRTRVLLDLPNSGNVQDTEIVVHDTDSRAEPVSTAAERVQAACRRFSQLGVGTLYKKIDSTLRGNVGVEVLAAWQEFRPTLTVVAPAYPKARRGTVGGYQLVDGLPVSLTEFSRDPKTPVKEALLPRLLSTAASRPVAHISLQHVVEGSRAIRLQMEHFLAQGQDWIVCDAVADEHLRSIAEAAAVFERVLWVGSAGLAEQLPVIYGWQQVRPAKLSAWCCNSVLVAAGSVSAVTQQQMDYYVEQTGAKLIIVNPVAAVLTPERESARLVAESADSWRHQSVAIACSNDRQALEAAAQAGREGGIDANGVGERIAGAISGAVIELVHQGIDGLFLTGGEIAVSCCRAMGATGIDIYTETSPGIPMGYLSGGFATGLPVVTKAGGFGSRDAILRGVNILKGRD